MKTRLLVLQGVLADYRRPVFNLLAQNYDVTVVHTGKPASRAKDGFTEIILPVKKIGRFRIFPWGAVRKHIDAADVTVAMFDLAWPAFVLPAIVCRPQGRYLLWGHRYGALRLANALRNFIMRRADGLIMYGDEHNEQMALAGIDPTRIFVAPNTMDVPNHQDFSGHTKNSFIFVGRLQERKRLDIALFAFAAIKGQIPEDTTFDIVGSGPPEAALRAQVEALGIADRVRFHGMITDNIQLAQLFATAYAYISPGPVGLAVLHSFAFGVPVLTLHEGYHGPEVYNIHNGENALIVDSAEQFAEAMQRLASDPLWSRGMGHAAYHHYATQRSIKVMVDGFRAAIEKAPVAT